MHRLWYQLLSSSTRYYTTTSATTIKTISEIPGPKSYPIIGTLWRYLPIIGEYNFERLHWNGAKKLKQYGPVVCEEIVPGVPIIWLFSPDDIETLYRTGEGRYPKRRSHLALQHFRLNRPHIYNSGGFLPTNGSEWCRLRQTIQKSISKPQNVKLYINETNETISKFIKLIDNKTDIEKHDFLPELSRLYTEITGLVAFDTKLGGLDEKDLPNDSKVAKLIDAAFQANSCVIKTDNGPQLWRWFPTPLYKKLEKSLLCLEQIAIELVTNKEERLKNEIRDENKPLSLLEQYLLSPDLDRKDVIGTAVDMLLAGVDTTSYTTSFALYHLAKNPEVQYKLHKEANEIFKNTDKYADEHTLDNASYVKAVLKEVLRLNPVSVGVGRILENDTIFSGYLVPKGTVVVTQNQVTCRQEEYFKNPNEFIPERWIKGNIKYESTANPFSSLPFGFGPRTCIARRLAEQSMQLTLLRIFRDYQVTWEGKGDLDCVSLLINKPDKPVLLKFKHC